MYEAYISNPTKGEELEERASVKRKWHREDNNCYLTTPHNSITQIRETKRKFLFPHFLPVIDCFLLCIETKNDSCPIPINNYKNIIRNQKLAKTFHDHSMLVMPKHNLQWISTKRTSIINYCASCLNSSLVLRWKTNFPRFVAVDFPAL